MDKVYGIVTPFPEVRMKFYENIRKNSTDPQFIRRGNITWVMLPELTYAVVEDAKHLTCPVDKKMELQFA